MSLSNHKSQLVAICLWTHFKWIKWSNIHQPQLLPPHYSYPSQSLPALSTSTPATPYPPILSPNTPNHACHSDCWCYNGHWPLLVLSVCFVKRLRTYSPHQVIQIPKNANHDGLVSTSLDRITTNTVKLGMTKSVRLWLLRIKPWNSVSS